MRKKSEVTDYKNFWLIWLNAASSKTGKSLFSIQTDWGIKTNYLYHNETGLKTPLYVRMIKDGYQEKSGKNLKANFSWIGTYVKQKYQVPQASADLWAPYYLISQKWGMVQDFIQTNHDKLFGQQSLKVLYKGNKDLLGDQGRFIFSDVFLYVLLTDVMAFARRYKADIVMRIILTAMSLFTERDLLNYMRFLNKQVSDVPNVINNEDELNRLMMPFTTL
jgi:hypothetical protein